MMCGSSAILDSKRVIPETKATSKNWNGFFATNHRDTWACLKCGTVHTCTHPTWQLFLGKVMINPWIFCPCILLVTTG